MKLVFFRVIALIIFARIVFGATFVERRLIVFDLVNIVYIFVMACGVIFSVMLSSCSTLVLSVREIIFRKRSVFVAYLLFIRKSYRLSLLLS